MDRRNTGKSQYKEINEEYLLLKNDFDRLRSERAESEKKRQRQELLSFRNPNERPPVQPLTEEHVARQESTILDYGQQQVEDYLAMGHQALESLRLQRGTFKGIERRALDIAQRLGLSNSVIRVIQGRSATDRLIFRGCVTLVCILLLWISYRRFFY